MGATVLHRLRGHALSQPECIAFQQADRNLRVVKEISYGDLWRQVCRGAEALRAKGEPGDRVILFFEPGLDPLIAFLSVLAARMIAVPAALPPAVAAALAQRKPAATRRVEAASNLVHDAGARIVLASETSGSDVATLFAHCDEPPRLWRFDDLSGGREAESTDPTLPEPEEVAFLQYTSGSTALPKGVVVTHANLASNLEAIGTFVRSHQESVFVSWLPMFHDMGLVGDSLHPIWVGGRCVKLLPPDFLRRPHLWMEAVSKFKGTITGGPNFAFQLAADHAKRCGESLDLSDLEVCYCGSEPIRCATMDSFSRAYEPYGLRRGSLFPCYGMAECTLLVSGVKSDEPFRTTPAAIVNETGFALGGSDITVSCGYPADAVVTIIDSETGAPLPDGVVGEISVRSRSVSPGYWKDLREKTKPRFTNEARTLHTGDLGFMHEGQVYVCGRIKNTLIVRGRKFLAEDLESLIESSLASSVERARAVVFPLANEKGEEIVVLIEGTLVNEERLVIATIRESLGETCGFMPAHVHLVRPGSVARTTSGKLQRQFAADLWNSRNTQTCAAL